MGLLVIEHAVGRILELRREPGESVRGAKEEVAMHSHLLLVPELEGDRVFHDFSCLEVVFFHQIDVSEAISLCWRTMCFSSDAQSFPCFLKEAELGE